MSGGLVDKQALEQLAKKHGLTITFHPSGGGYDLDVASGIGFHEHAKRMQAFAQERAAHRPVEEPPKDSPIAREAAVAQLLEEAADGFPGGKSRVMAIGAYVRGMLALEGRAGNGTSRVGQALLDLTEGPHGPSSPAGARGANGPAALTWAASRPPESPGVSGPRDVSLPEQLRSAAQQHLGPYLRELLSAAADSIDGYRMIVRDANAAIDAVRKTLNP